MVAVHQQEDMSTPKEQEVWKVVSDYPDYEVSDFGRVRRTTASHRSPAGYILKPYLSADYLRVSLFAQRQRRDIPVHILVMRVFVGPTPLGMEVLHEDGNKINCRLSNLRYGTRKQNKADGYRLNEISSRVTVEQVLEIRRLREEGKTLQEIADQFHIGTTTVSNITRRKHWRNV